MPLEWDKIHEENNFRLVTAPLALISFIYGVAVKCRLAVLKRRKKRVLPGFVLSIGNLTAGGTGKTPVSCLLAEWALGNGHGVAILSRGYGGHYKKKVLVVSDGKKVLAGPEEAGDEPFLLAQRLPGVPVIISKNRYSAGLVAKSRFDSNFFILDDGFQHMTLKRDLDLVLVDTLNPFGNGHLLPWGPLREPVQQLSRADAFIFTRSRPNPKAASPETIFKYELQGKPVFKGDHIPERIIFPFIHRDYGPEFLKGKRIFAFAGIARPGTFKDTLNSLGAKLAAFKYFPDHHSFSAKEIRDLGILKEKSGADYLVTTEKDWVRVKDIIPKHPDLAYLKIHFSLLSGKEDFFRMIKEKLEGIQGL